VQDFLHPDRIVIGADSPRAEQVMRRVYEPITSGPQPVPMIVTDVQSAELIKHASNSFLALKISYINAVASICERCGANVDEVANGMGYDRRIGRAFLDAGVGYGGSCFPKDVAAFYQISRELGYDFDLLRVVMEINAAQRAAIVKKLRDALWILKDKTIAVLGLAFKPNTDDVRESPAIDVIRLLQAEGSRIRACDPRAMQQAAAVLHDVELCADAYEACRGADAAVLITDWDEFRSMDLARIRAALNYPILIDGRNVFDPTQMARLGFEYQSVGRPRPRA
jgi:UDPglucose 6-dehydrogenase